MVCNYKMSHCQEKGRLGSVLLKHKINCWCYYLYQHAIVCSLMKVLYMASRNFSCHLLWQHRNSDFIWVKFCSWVSVFFLFFLVNFLKHGISRKQCCNVLPSVHWVGEVSGGLLLSWKIHYATWDYYSSMKMLSSAGCLSSLFPVFSLIAFFKNLRSW